MKKISILGSTGSVGTQCLDIISEFKDQFEVISLTASKNEDKLKEQLRTFKPKYYLSDSETVHEFGKRIKSFDELLKIDDSDLIVIALSGISGFMPVLISVEQGRNIALANKESLVACGDLLTELSEKNNSNIIPLDSEHSAIWQCLEGEKANYIKNIILTGSGGPFRELDVSKFSQITKKDALKHPNWSMGSKITIDSATMMNKGLEVIEAFWLFNIPINNIEIIVHPQSIIHSMVEFIDGSIKAQLGEPSMTIPIHYAMNYPKRTKSIMPKFDFLEYPNLTFQKPDIEKFRCIKLAYDAIKLGDSYPLVLNVVNDICVNAFLNDKIKFIDIPIFIEDALQSHNACKIDDIDSIFSIIDSTKNIILRKLNNN